MSICSNIFPAGKIIKKKEMLKALDDLIEESKKLERLFKKQGSNQILRNKFYSWNHSIARIFKSYFYNLKENITLEYILNVQNLKVEEPRSGKTDYCKTLEVRRNELLHIREEIAQERVPQEILKIKDYARNMLSSLALPCLGFVLLKVSLPNLKFKIEHYGLLVALLILSIPVYFPSMSSLGKKIMYGLGLLGTVIAALRNFF